MTIGELLLKLRRRLRDEATKPSDQLWTDEELIDEYANEVREELFRAAPHLLIDSTTAESATGVELCTIAVTDGTAKYAINEYVSSIQRAQFTTLYHPLTERSVSWMDDNIVNWKYDDTEGTPYIYISDLDTGYITLYPTPDAGLTLNLTVTRRAITPLTAASLTAELGFLSEFHTDIIYGILQLAYEKKDSQTDRPELAMYYERKFERRLDKLRIDSYHRMHGPATQRIRWANMAK